MPSLKEIRTRVASVRSTRKITGAMKMVAASRLRRVQNRIVHSRDYARMLRRVTDEVMAYLPPREQNVYMKVRETRDVLVIVVGSNRGLCGTYNALLIREGLKRIREYEDQGRRVHVMPLGKKIERFFQKQKWQVIPCDHSAIDRPSYASAAGFADQAMGLYLKLNLSQVVVVYNRFRNAVVSDMTGELVLPVHLERPVAAEELEKGAQDGDAREKLILEPTPGEVVNYMAEQSIRYNFHRILLDASASEHGSRMTAMHKATDNADDMIASLTLSYNKMRQASITRELIDIVGGAERDRT